MIMIILPDTFIRVVAAGGGITIDLEKQIVLPDTMLKVAAAGRGNVIFDFS